MYILAMAVTPTAVLQQVNVQQPLCESLCETPRLPRGRKKKKKQMREFVKSVEEVLKHFPIIRLSKEMTGPL